MVQTLRSEFYMKIRIAPWSLGLALLLPITFSACEKDKEIAVASIPTPCMIDMARVEATLLEEEFTNVGLWTITVVDYDTLQKQPYADLINGKLELHSGGWGDYAEAQLSLKELALSDRKKFLLEIGISYFRRPDAGSPSSEFTMEILGHKFSTKPISATNYCAEDCANQIFENTTLEVLVDLENNTLHSCSDEDKVELIALEATTNNMEYLRFASYPYASKSDPTKMLATTTKIDFVRVRAYKE